jgi:hypothetical protein
MSGPAAELYTIGDASIVRPVRVQVEANCAAQSPFIVVLGDGARVLRSDK